ITLIVAGDCAFCSVRNRRTAYGSARNYRARRIFDDTGNGAYRSLREERRTYGEGGSDAGKEVHAAPLCILRRYILLPPMNTLDVSREPSPSDQLTCSRVLPANPFNHAY